MSLILVECSNEYWEYVRLLRLNPKVIDGFIQKVNITKDEQIDYMKKYASCYRVALLNSQPCGYVGVIENDIRVCTDPEYQGRGIGKFMISEVKKIWPNAIAKIKVSNSASLKLFEACGYKIEYYLMNTENQE